MSIPALNQLLFWNTWYSKYPANITKRPMQTHRAFFYALIPSGLPSSTFAPLECSDLSELFLIYASAKVEL